MRVGFLDLGVVGYGVGEDLIELAASERAGDTGVGLHVLPDGVVRVRVRLIEPRRLEAHPNAR